ncbi:hypothetical protein GCM10020369_52620 [Cryptosporangium minutisporangium]|uniref:DUF4272 domain-containing protein n=2 Tax=Cryptosporangium minutisporangium TaxID=113569 RepID=A0ABP6T5L8_9ACTN
MANDPDPDLGTVAVPDVDTATPAVAAPLAQGTQSGRAAPKRRAGAEPDPEPEGQTTPAPDPVMIRAATLADLADLGFPPPPDGYPLVWEPGDAVALRPTAEILARCAVLNAVLAGVFGAPPELTCGWLERNDLVDAVTAPEWEFLSERKGSGDLYGLHVEALWAFAWVLGVGEDLDPGRYCGEGLAAWLPDIGAGESFGAWQGRAGVRPRPAAEVAALLDLHYCLDWGHVQALMNDEPPPGVTLPYVIGQRRWALEWAVTFRGPYHPAPPRWDEVDLAS